MVNTITQPIAQPSRTFGELLGGFTMEQLWYVLSMRHGLPPIRAEKLFAAYRGAREELLCLEPADGKSGALRCGMVIDNSNGGAPEVWFDTTIVYDDGETYAVDFIDWAELVRCVVDTDCLEKYGAMVVTAEILWEVTFYGYSRSAVNGEGAKLNADYSQSLVSWDEMKAELDERAANPDVAKVTAEWLKNAPEPVKRRIFEKLQADVIENDLDEDLSDAMFLQIVKDRAESSAYKYKDCVDAESLLCTMLNRLDYNDMALLGDLLVDGVKCND